MVVDKPAGITSAQVVARVKRKLGLAKVGHTGTLDPFATGVMLCCLNQATKLAQFFLHGDKSYEGTLCLGVETDTQDLTGRVTRTGETGNLSDDDVLKVMAQFKGDLLQVPPAYSALKHQGTPLYKLARAGQPIQKPPRKVHISALEVTGMALPEVRFTVRCSAGTYIRTLCADIGTVLGCGGHLKALRRIESCGFTVSESVRMDDLDSLSMSGDIWNRTIPMAAALRDLPQYVADSGLSAHIRHGRPLTKQDLNTEVADREGFIKVVDTHGRLLSVLQAEGDSLAYRCVFPLSP